MPGDPTLRRQLQTAKTALSSLQHWSEQIDGLAAAAHDAINDMLRSKDRRAQAKGVSLLIQMRRANEGLLTALDNLLLDIIESSGGAGGPDPSAIVSGLLRNLAPTLPAPEMQALPAMLRAELSEPDADCAGDAASAG
jgi:hypothetical protein